MRKRFSVLLLSLLCVLFLSGCVVTKELPDPNFEFRIDPNTLEITILRYKGEASEVIFPDTLQDKPVKALANTVFNGAEHVTSIHIPANLVNIADTSFRNLPNLTTITVAEENPSYTVQDDVLYHKKMKTIYCYPQGKAGDVFELPTSISAIGAGAFYHCQLREIVLSEGTSKINAYAFAESPNLEKINLPAKVTAIGENAFENCVKLQTIEFPPRVATIGNRAFAGCTSLKNAVLPENINTLGAAAFQGCTALETVEASSAALVRLYEGTFKDCTSLKTITFAQPIAGVSESCFENCISLERFELTDSISDIGAKAFYGCARLSEVYLPEKLSTIGARAFHGTAFLENQTEEWVITSGGVLLAYRGTQTDVTTPENVKSVSYLKPSVTRVTVNEGATILCTGAFMDCESLEEVILPSTLKTMSAQVFKNCLSLKSFHVPAALERIGDYCFDNCPALAQFTVHEKNINFFLHDGVLYDNSKKYIVRVAPAGSMTEYIVPYGITGMYKGAIQGVKNLQVFDARKAESITATSENALADCPNLHTVKFNFSFQDLGDYTFKNCTALSDYTTSLKLEYIGKGCFENCTSLKEMRLADMVVIILEDAFKGMDCTFSIYDSPETERYFKGNNIPYVQK